MATTIKDEKAILHKLGIKALNPMQEEAREAIGTNSEVVLLSPTGTGKTLAFLLPILTLLDQGIDEVQVLILVPSRELAIQIEQVTREMGSGFKTNAVYGGRSGSKDRIELKHPPAILIGTPGRVADHLRRESISTSHISTIVFDEFDKSLEVGFESEMREILAALPAIKKKIFTSATQRIDIPKFVQVKDAKFVNYLVAKSDNLKLKVVTSDKGSILNTLAQLLLHLEGKSGIVFCNLKDSIQILSDFLNSKDIDHTCFYGGLEQMDRERALIKFRNGTHRVLIATDLAARGIDVPQMDYIIHYELPFKEAEFIHRNGRTARMKSEGSAFILQDESKSLPHFIKGAESYSYESMKRSHFPTWKTLFISGGRKDKISKGDIAGLFMKQGSLAKDELGVIELKQDCAFVAVPSSKASELIQQLNNSKLKKKKVRISILE